MTISRYLLYGAIDEVIFMEYTADCASTAAMMRAAAAPANFPAACLGVSAQGAKKILLVEDYQTLQLLYSEELAEEGYEVALCSDCATLLDMIRVHRPDIIILDIMLGSHNTLDMLQDIYAMSQGALVLLHSAYPYAYLKNTFRITAAEYLVKSADIKPMKDKLRCLAGRC